MENVVLKITTSIKDHLYLGNIGTPPWYMLARTINASWNQANNKTFGPGHIYRYQIRILHIKHFYPQLTDKNGNQMENLGSLTLAGLVETGFAGNVIVSDWF